MKRYYLTILILVTLVGCTKESKWLDVKSNKSDVVPSTLLDYQALLDNDRIMNEDYGGLCNASSDNMYVQDVKWTAAGNAQERNAYIWNDVFYNGEPGFDWNYLYQKVGQANIVLDGVEKLQANKEDNIYKNIVGSALFYRSLAFYNLTQEFTKPYDPLTSKTDPGIILKLTSQVQEKAFRSSIQACYDQITSDLDKAELLLPSVQPYKTRPTKISVLALKARIYLSLSNYNSALLNAKSALNEFGSLLDYNTISLTPTFPFPKYAVGNIEIQFFCLGNSFGIGSYNTALIDPEIYSQYAVTDLRKAIFYKDNGVNGITFRGDYASGGGAHFHGFASNELYLIQAECEARAGNVNTAMSLLNTLLVKRYKTGTFTPLTAASPQEALLIILNERRKELPFTGNLRWEDLRRLNRDQKYAKTLIRTVYGITYKLEPKSPRYALPIPDDEIRISGVQQNER